MNTEQKRDYLLANGWQEVTPKVFVHDAVGAPWEIDSAYKIEQNRNVKYIFDMAGEEAKNLHKGNHHG